MTSSTLERPRPADPTPPPGQPPAVVCAECGTLFAPATSRSRFCSSTCRYRHRDRRKYAADPERERARARAYYQANRDERLAAANARTAEKRRRRDLGPTVAEWMADVQVDAQLLEFAERLDDVCREARDVSGRELEPRHAAAIVLRVAARSAEGERREKRRR